MLSSETKKLIQDSYGIKSLIRKLSEEQVDEVNSWLINIGDLKSIRHLSELKFLIDNDMDTRPICSVCGSTIQFRSSTKSYPVFCTRKCMFSDKGLKERAEKTKQTCLDKYGVENVFDCPEVQAKIKQTLMDNYGVENPMMVPELVAKIKETTLERYGVEHVSHLDYFKDKREQTCLERYGAKTPLSNQEIRDKIKQTCLERYGNEYYINSEEGKEKTKESVMERYGVEYIMQSEEMKEKARKTSLEKFGVTHYAKTDASKEAIYSRIRKARVESVVEHLSKKDILINMPVNDFLDKRSSYDYLCSACNTEFSSEYTNATRVFCPNCSRAPYSREERRVAEWIQGLTGLHCEFNVRGLHGIRKELDIFIPDRQLGVEYNGAHWHSELYVDKHYHKNKVDEFEKNGTSVVSVLETHWLFKENIVKSIISSRLGLYSDVIGARKTKVVKLNSKEYRSFLEINHLQGYAPASHKYGLKYRDEILMVMSFSKSRFSSEYDWENIRTCTKLNTRVQGGFNRLLQAFIREVNPSNIVSYIDRDYFTGKGYERAGFAHVRNTEPGYFYINTNTFDVLSRYQCQKSKLDKLLDNYDATLTEKQNMNANGYYQYYNTGNKVMVLDLRPNETEV